MSFWDALDDFGKAFTGLNTGVNSGLNTMNTLNNVVKGQESNDLLAAQLADAQQAQAAREAYPDYYNLLVGKAAEGNREGMSKAQLGNLQAENAYGFLTDPGFQEELAKYPAGSPEWARTIVDYQAANGDPLGALKTYQGANLTKEQNAADTQQAMMSYAQSEVERAYGAGSQIFRDPMTNEWIVYNGAGERQPLDPRLATLMTSMEQNAAGPMGTVQSTFTMGRQAGQDQTALLRALLSGSGRNNTVINAITNNVRMYDQQLNTLTDNRQREIDNLAKLYPGDQQKIDTATEQINQRFEESKQRILDAKNNLIMQGSRLATGGAPLNLPGIGNIPNGGAGRRSPAPGSEMITVPRILGQRSSGPAVFQNSGGEPATGNDNPPFDFTSLYGANAPENFGYTGQPSAPQAEQTLYQPGVPTAGNEPLGQIIDQLRQDIAVLRPQARLSNPNRGAVIQQIATKQAQLNALMSQYQQSVGALGPYYGGR